MLPPTPVTRIIPSPVPRLSLQSDDERKPDVHEYVEMQAEVPIVTKQKETTKNEIKTVTKLARKSHATRVRKAAPSTGAKRTERRKQKDTDEDMMKQWKTSFSQSEERKNLGEKEYRIRTTKINKMKVDRLMQSIGQSKKIQKEN